MEKILEFVIHLYYQWFKTCDGISGASKECIHCSLYNTENDYCDPYMEEEYGKK